MSHIVACAVLRGVVLTWKHLVAAIFRANAGVGEPAPILTADTSGILISVHGAAGVSE